MLSFQGDVAMGTVKTLLPTLIPELRRDGQIDRARHGLRRTGHEEALVASRIVAEDGRLWQSESAEDRQRGRMRSALLHDHSGFIARRMEAFVGREAELAEIRQRIAESLPTGGYVMITVQAGQGKSSVIAKLVADVLLVSSADRAALREKLLQPGAGVPVSHFIPFSPGPDHQVSLLRNLIARLCLAYGLPDFYVASDSRSALRDYFDEALRELVQQGKQEIIYEDSDTDNK